MAEHICRIAGCSEPVESQGLCPMHFTRALIYGQVRLPSAKQVECKQPKPAVSEN